MFASFNDVSRTLNVNETDERICCKNIWLLLALNRLLDKLLNIRQRVKRKCQLGS